MEVLQRCFALLKNGLKADDFQESPRMQNMPDAADELDGLCVLQPSDLGEANRFRGDRSKHTENGIMNDDTENSERMGTAKSLFHHNNKKC